MSKYDITDSRSFASAMKAIRDKLDNMVDNVNENVAKAVADCAIDCLDRAVQRAPVETGNLRSSGYADFNNRAFLNVDADASGSTVRVIGTPEPRDTVEAEVGFAAVYAHRQHEDMDMRHDRTDGYRRKDGTTVNMVAGGQAKYLESVVVENISKWAAHIKDAARDGLTGGE